jgi:hypothetical protein
MYFRVHRYSISMGNESSLEAVKRFVRSKALGLQNGIAKVGEDTYLILVNEEQWSDSGSRFFVKYSPVNPDLQPIATVEEKSSEDIVSFRVKVEIYPFMSDEVVVKEQGERCWKDRARVSWGRKLAFRRDSDFVEEVLEE